MSNLKDQNWLPSQHLFEIRLEASSCEHVRLSVTLRFFCPFVRFYMRKQILL